MTAGQIAELLDQAAGVQLSEGLAGRFELYLALLLRWNKKTNLTAVRDPGEIVVKHFGESLQLAYVLPAEARTMLDVGSGAGFPGAVCALARPEIAVTLAESHGKKAAFLQELCRETGLTATVYAGRAESLPRSESFDVVSLRAVERMQLACRTSAERLTAGGSMALLTTRSAVEKLADEMGEFEVGQKLPLRGTREGLIVFCKRVLQ